MTRRSSFTASAVFVTLAALATYLGPGRGLFGDSAEAIGSAARPYVLATPAYIPKTGTNATLRLTSMEDFGIQVEVRRYDDAGGLMTSPPPVVTIGAKGTTLASAAANSGDEMHVEVWSPSPNLALEVTYTDSSDAVRTIAFGDMLQPRGGGTFQALSPFRVCDTRRTNTNCIGGILNAGSEIAVPVAGVNGIPTAGVTAVVLNLTVTGATAGGFLAAWPDGTTRPNASSLNFGKGQTLANMVTVKLGTNGRVRVFNALGDAHVIMDLAGFYM